MRMMECGGCHKFFNINNMFGYIHNGGAFSGGYYQYMCKKCHLEVYEDNKAYWKEELRKQREE